MSTSYFGVKALCFHAKVVSVILTAAIQEKKEHCFENYLMASLCWAAVVH